MTGILESIAYYAALLVVATLPPAILYWLLIHPFASFWRRLGKGATFSIVSLVCLALAILIGRQHEWILATHWGFHGSLIAIGFGLYLIGIYGERQIRKHLKFRILVGVPEIAGEAPGKLLTEGIYSRSRNPRYVNGVLATLGWSMILNYPALYITTALLVPGLWVVVLFEERELRQRFGDEYLQYCREVPRFLPRLGRSA